MIDYSKQFNDIMAQIQAQYKGSNVAQLIEGIIEIKKKGVLRAYKSLIDDCLNLSTARGDALDLWGYILGINRFVPRDSTQDAKENFKQWNFNKSNFKHLIFLQVRDHLYHRLEDDDFRNLLLLFLQRQYIFASPREAQSLIDDYISKKYGELNILDTQKMSMAVEFSFNDYPDWMRWYILLKDIIPRPAGVKIDMMETPEPEPIIELAPEPEPIIELAPEPQALIFTAQEASSSITLNKVGNREALQLEYRTNTNTTWQNYTLGTTINLANIDDWVEMRNQGLQTLNNTRSDYHQFVMTGKIAASGNIQYLLDKTGELLSVYDDCYSSLFQGCTSLTTAPALPATTLANNCYENMFYGCTSLTTAPKLPATTLADDCYNAMFAHCSNLTTAPELPARTLADRCYKWMFDSCTSLTTAPELPATTLANDCYYAMFAHCSKLKVNQNGSGNKIFTCPSTSGLTDPVQGMFYGTGGSFKGDPTTGNTYNWYN